MAFLLLVLGIGWAYRTGTKAYNQYQQYSDLVAERNAIRDKTTKIKSNMKKAERIQKELEKNSAISAGDPVFLNKLYDLSLALPEDALVTSFRFTDGNCDLQIQTQNRNLDLSQRMHFSYWRIARLQQRIISDTVVTFTVSLVKNEVQQ